MSTTASILWRRFSSAQTKCGSYSKWITELQSINALNTMLIYEESNSKWKRNNNKLSQFVVKELDSWCDTFGLMSDKIKNAKVPQLSIATAPYLSIFQVTEYAKLQSFMYLMDDLLFDNLNIWNESKATMVENMIKGIGTNCKINEQHINWNINLLNMYDCVLQLPTICNGNYPLMIKQELHNYLYFSLKEDAFNSFRTDIIHYNEYLTHRRYSSGTILCGYYLSCIMSESSELSLYINDELLHLCCDIIILINDLLGFDRESENGEICTYPLLLKYHDNLNDIDAQEQTYQLLISKINQFKILANSFFSTNQIDMNYKQQFIIFNAWIIGYYQHEINCKRQQIHK
eukprot:351352_1